MEKWVDGMRCYTCFMNHDAQLLYSAMEKYVTSIAQFIGCVSVIGAEKWLVVNESC